ncbi:hypothetical protein CYV19_18030 [Natronobacterium gregoryi SP2]|uniref:Uncharacterized protein n=1 Tax=Natronobacterium gregoryi (strain ATCC 43098 / DSM 3393 / CCM 3738 / CIP 104747 / IAM 13177 / JCM 8860 / NBRC 102187 / NCIMB 2189 / SP2) TaxID=797304 RepID=L9XTY3_NATGS|nr:hypothetical protein C490_14310 [Natronobacterium gregoryi SP2]PLK18371.1 hypothetical protein CYV19_18030 [Natronobacterium gregoryi SP2]
MKRETSGTASKESDCTEVEPLRFGDDCDPLFGGGDDFGTEPHVQNTRVDRAWLIVFEVPLVGLSPSRRPTFGGEKDDAV